MCPRIWEAAQHCTLNRNGETCYECGNQTRNLHGRDSNLPRQGHTAWAKSDALNQHERRPGV